jgi:hypothetical protein
MYCKRAFFCRNAQFYVSAEKGFCGIPAEKMPSPLRRMSKIKNNRSAVAGAGLREVLGE